MNLIIAGTVPKEEIERLLRAEIEKETGRKVKKLSPKCTPIYGGQRDESVTGYSLEAYEFELFPNEPPRF